MMGVNETESERDERRRKGEKWVCENLSFGMSKGDTGWSWAGGERK